MAWQQAHHGSLTRLLPLYLGTSTSLGHAWQRLLVPYGHHMRHLCRLFYPLAAACRTVDETLRAPTAWAVPLLGDDGRGRGAGGYTCNYALGPRSTRRLSITSVLISRDARRPARMR